MRKAALLLVVLSLSAVVTCGEEVKFASKPTAKKNGGEVEISFSVTGPTDVSVAILDAEGKVVRHLAAGAIGAPSTGSGQGKAPAPLKPGLSQTLLWDGKDDLGRAATGGPFKARVRLGMRPAFDGFIGYDPASYNPLRSKGMGYGLPFVRAVATGPKGEVFVFHTFAGGSESWSITLGCAVFDREGKYLRTIVPYPANTPEEKLKGLRRVELEAGTRVPYLYHTDRYLPQAGRGRSLLPIAAESAEGGNATQVHRAVATRDGRVAFVSSPFEAPDTRAVCVVNADGTVPPDGPIKATFEKRVTSATLALSPDEKTLYASAVSRSGRGGGPVDVVYKFGWEEKAPKPFVSTGLKNPRGVAVDVEDNLYVADRGNDRVAVFRADGSPLGELKVEKPERVEVHPKTGAVYVLAGERVNQLLKFASWKTSRPEAKAEVPSFRHKLYTAGLALDASADPPVLWVYPRGPAYARFTLLRIEDKGNAFGEGADLARLPANSPVFTGGDVMTVSCSPDARVLNVGSRFYDVARGEFLNLDASCGSILRAKGAAGSFGLDGNFYVHQGMGTYRLGPDLKMKPFPKPARDSEKYSDAVWKRGVGGLDKYGAISGIGGSARLRARGVTADPAGNVYVLSEIGWVRDYPTALSKYGPDGAKLKERLIDADFRCVESVRLDYAGDIYVAVAIRPGQQLLPPGLEGKVPADPKGPDALRGRHYYPGLYGSIIKFGPAGGIIKKGCGGTACNYGYDGVTEVKGAEWIHLGITGTLGFEPKCKPNMHCACQSSRFDVDGFGRVFYPDAGRFRVWVMDTAANQIAHFGSYGNVDSGGPKSRIPGPDIPLAWPQAVAVDDAGGAVYVGDRLNRRVVRVKLNYAAEETCPVR
jgi:sugar lactone lactonase YvrE